MCRNLFRAIGGDLLEEREGGEAVAVEEQWQGSFGQRRAFEECYWIVRKRMKEGLKVYFS